MNQDTRSLTDIVKEIVPEFGKGIPVSEGSTRRYGIWLDEGTLEKELSYRNHSASASELLDFFTADYNTLGKTGTVQEKRKFFGHTMLALAVYDAMKRIMKNKPDHLALFNAIAPKIKADYKLQTDVNDLPDELLFEPVKYALKKGAKGKPTQLAPKLTEIAMYMKGICDNMMKFMDSGLEKRTEEMDERFAQYHVQHAAEGTMNASSSKTIKANYWDAYNAVVPLIMSLAGAEAK